MGLGEGDSTPIGQFIVRADGKLENPGWVNPRNPAEKYGPNDAANPIGDFWVGLDGLGDAAAYAGYGLHGTIDPDSIGRGEAELRFRNTGAIARGRIIAPMRVRVQRLERTPRTEFRPP